MMSFPDLLILLLFPLTTNAYSTGAPDQVCKNLQPGEKTCKKITKTLKIVINVRDAFKKKKFIWKEKFLTRDGRVTDE